MFTLILFAYMETSRIATAMTTTTGFRTEQHCIEAGNKAKTMHKNIQFVCVRKEG